MCDTQVGSEFFYSQENIFLIYENTSIVTTIISLLRNQDTAKSNKYNSNRVNYTLSLHTHFLLELPTHRILWKPNQSDSISFSLVTI